jgi:hypothetical protein
MLAGLVPLNPGADLGGLRTVPPVPRLTRGARARPFPFVSGTEERDDRVSGMFGGAMGCFAIRRKGD